ncbi:MAG: hypothetical protein KBB39_17850 [Phycicoccus sp.]|nr:hypothetical protein [Phycicoccus sp.]
MATGVRRILNNAADRALATRHAEAWYVATVLATAATSWALLTIAFSGSGSSTASVGRCVITLQFQP